MIIYDHRKILNKIFGAKKLPFLKHLIRWFTFVAYIGLYFIGVHLALQIFLRALLGSVAIISFLLIVILGIVIFILSSLIHKKFSHRFIVWPSRERTGRPSLSWLGPPISTSVFSLSLSVFILSFLDQNMYTLWNNYIRIDVIGLYQQIAVNFIFSPIFVVIFVLLLFFPVFVVAKLAVGRDNLKGAILVILFIFFWLVLLNLFIFYGVSPIDKALNFLVESIFTPLAILVIGSLPVGWFYELFVGSLLRDL